MTNEHGPLSGLRILVPRGGSWGSVVAKAVRSAGGTPVVSPLIDFATTSEEEKLREALQKLQEGYFDWMTATNAIIVDVLAHHNVVIADRTQVAVVGETTYQAFVDADYVVAAPLRVQPETLQRVCLMCGQKSMMATCRRF